ncbi:DUF397 domain-containing protein [Nocardia lasii]|uniref:DUF397 domain-containing protein n=1 Tax=Nocardia lasii TaxID=1616107 RepID=A0ABW1JQZ7_9NOCA
MSATARPHPADNGWFTSSYSNNGNQCVEVRFTENAVQIRDSKFRRTQATAPQPVITVPIPVWMAFLAALRTTTPHPTLIATTTPDGSTTLHHNRVTLHFTAPEWTAFLSGVHADEFACA